MLDSLHSNWLSCFLPHRRWYSRVQSQEMEIQYGYQQVVNFVWTSAISRISTHPLHPYTRPLKTYHSCSYSLCSLCPLPLPTWPLPKSSSSAIPSGASNQIALKTKRKETDTALAAVEDARKWWNITKSGEGTWVYGSALCGQIIRVKVFDGGIVYNSWLDS